jgi:hypothetical protein
MPPIELANGVDARHKIVSVGKRPNQLDLQVLAWPANLDAIVLRQPLKELNTVPEHPLPAVEDPPGKEMTVS